MSVIAVGYAVDLNAIASIAPTDARAMIDVALDDLSKGRKDIENERMVLERVFGFTDSSKHPRNLSVAFRWVCRNFGEAIETPSYVHGVYSLEVDTRLLEGLPPFGFPGNDENISHLRREDVKTERIRFAKCVEEAANESLALERESFLVWLNTCIEKGTDLVVIQS